MQLTTSFDIPTHPKPISHSDKILSIGSCFAESMGERMQKSKMDILINPFGTLFHPIPICQLLEAALQDKYLPENMFLKRDGMHFHYWTHSKVVGHSFEELRGKLTGERLLTKEFLLKSNYLILTLGTGWLYELSDTSEPVANCHKQPSKLFNKRLTGLEEMSNHLKKVIILLKELNPHLEIILTVSPVRHIKDGIPENQLSKSLLRVLCGEFESQFGHIHYFPSYEIMVDELRDYRFYKPDLIHPSTQAEEYIWDKWKSALFTKEAQSQMDQIKSIQLELDHRPLNPKSDSHQKFLRNLKEKLERLNSQFDFSIELEKVSTELSNF